MDDSGRRRLIAGLLAVCGAWHACMQGQLLLLQQTASDIMTGLPVTTYAVVTCMCMVHLNQAQSNCATLLHGLVSNDHCFVLGSDAP